MSTIYAPVNSVNTFKTIKTALPLDVNLSDEETKELLSLERLYLTSSRNSEQLGKEFSVWSTTNEGIHYFCIENSFNLRKLVRNPNLTPVTVFLLHQAVKKHHSESKASLSFSLLANPSVYQNHDVFEFVLKEIPEHWLPQVVTGVESFLEDMCVGAFMFMMPYFKLTERASSCEQIAQNREQEILDWVAQTTPDLAGLPLSWLLKAYGKD